jgi:cytochrome c peroxidase
MLARIACLAMAGLAVAACSGSDADEGFPAPRLPEDSVHTPESIELGRHLFYDERLSVNEQISCSNCHRQAFAFADNRPTSPGATGEIGVLNAPSLANVAYAAPLTWAHARIETIEQQLLGPMFGEAPIEMGMAGNEAEIAARLRADDTYIDLYAAAFGDGALERVGALDDARYALASFVRSLVSDDSAFDRFLDGDASAMDERAVRGSELFYSARLGCGNCHAGFAMTVASRSVASTGSPSAAFHNIGLYNIDGAGGYPAEAPGLVAESGIERDTGRFRVPSLRNVALTAPYMHDGSIASLEDVIRIYERGGRQITDGPNAGDGRLSPLRSEQLRDFDLTDTERADLIAFLTALTDESLVTDPRHTNPW